MTIALALLLGITAGLRSMTPLAAVAWAAHFGWLRLDGTITLTDIGPMVRYAASADGFYDDVIDRPWPAVMADLAAAAQRRIDRDGVLTVHAGCGLLVARVA